MNAKTIAILSAGPPKRGRIRHLEKFDKVPVITTVINACTFENIKTCVVIRKDNFQLQTYLENNHSNVKIIKSPDLGMLSTFKCALYEDDNDTLIVAGDLRTIKKENVEAFIKSPYKSAIYQVKIPWGKNIISKNKKLIRRGDIGDSLLLISNDHKNLYLSDENINQAKNFFHQFYPKRHFNVNVGNHLWTWLDYSFFHEISSSQENKNCTDDQEKGAIFIENRVYLDND